MAGDQTAMVDIAGLKVALGLNRLGAKLRYRAYLPYLPLLCGLYLPYSLSVSSEDAFHNMVASSQEATTATTYTRVTTSVARHVSHNSSPSIS